MAKGTRTINSAFDYEGRIAELEAEQQKTDDAITNLSGRIGDLEDKIDRLLHQLRGQIDLRAN